MTASAAPSPLPKSINHTAKVVFMYSLKSMHFFLSEMSKWYVCPLISIWRRNKQTNPLHSTCNFMCVKRRENIFWLWRTCICYYHVPFKTQKDVLTIEKSWGRDGGEARANILLFATVVTLITGQKAVSEPSAVVHMVFFIYLSNFLHLKTWKVKSTSADKYP